MNNNQQLRQYYDSNKVNYADIADMLGVSYFTVRSWLSNPGSAVYRKMPDSSLKLLKLLTK